MEIIKYCKALADETRSRLVNVLLEYELNVGEIVQVMEMGQSRISRHLKILSESGLVDVRREGLWAFYRASDSGPGRDFLDGVASLLEGEDALKRDRNRAEKVIRERTAATRQFFDDIAPEWDRMTAEVLGDLNLGHEIRERLPDCTCAADIGCGPGDMLEILAATSQRVIGVDNSPKMLELAEERFSDDASMSLRIGEMTHLAADEELTGTVMSLVLHHLPARLTPFVKQDVCFVSVADCSSPNSTSMKMNSCGANMVTAGSASLGNTCWSGLRCRVSRLSKSLNLP